MDIVEQYKRITKDLGCSNGNCIFKKRTGMVTNGVCGCFAAYKATKPEIMKLRHIARMALEMSDEIEKLRAENEALRAASEWQPIETAPFNTEFLAALSNGRVTTLYKRKHDHYINREYNFDWYEGYNMRVPIASSHPPDSLVDSIIATHWRPLPIPPKGSVDG